MIYVYISQTIYYLQHSNSRDNSFSFLNMLLWCEFIRKSQIENLKNFGINSLKIETKLICASFDWANMMKLIQNIISNTNINNSLVLNNGHSSTCRMIRSKWTMTLKQIAIDFNIVNEHKYFESLSQCMYCEQKSKLSQKSSKVFQQLPHNKPIRTRKRHKC